MWVFGTIKCSKAVFEDASGLEVLCSLQLPLISILSFLLFYAKHCSLVIDAVQKENMTKVPNDEYYLRMRIKCNEMVGK